MRKLLIIGAGGHGICCLDIARDMDIFDKISFFDDNHIDETINDYKVIVSIAEMNAFYLEYEKMSLLTGEYYFDIAFFEEHATVPLVYKTKYVTMFITGRYAGEGIVILDHKWKDTTKDEV